MFEVTVELSWGRVSGKDWIGDNDKVTKESSRLITRFCDHFKTPNYSFIHKALLTTLIALESLYLGVEISKDNNGFLMQVIKKCSWSPRWHANNWNQQQVSCIEISDIGRKVAKDGGIHRMLHLCWTEEEYHFPLWPWHLSQLCRATKNLPYLPEANRDENTNILTNVLNLFDE